MKLDESDVVAEELLSQLKTKYKIIFTGKRLNKMWNDNNLRNTYKIILKNNNGEATFTFWDSIAATKNNEYMSIYDFLACLTKNDVGTYSDFCCEFGYHNSIDSRKIYHAVKEEYSKLKKLFTDEELELISEAVY